jgi:hypothetical protein
MKAAEAASPAAKVGMGGRAWQYSDAERRRANWTMNRIVLVGRRRLLANASVRRRVGR